MQRVKKEIAKLRKEIDEIDKQLINLLSKRKEIVLKIGKIKKENKLRIEDKKREKDIIRRIETMSKKKNVDPTLAKKIIMLLIQNAKKIQSSISRRKRSIQ